MSEEFSLNLLKTLPKMEAVEAPEWDGIPRFGYSPDHEQSLMFQESLAIPRMCAVQDFGDTLAEPKEDVFLWLGLMKQKPSWVRGNQAIGSCVAWGAELVATMLMGIESTLGLYDWIEEASTEAVYGGCRVEARDGRLGGYSDGAVGAWAAKFHHEWGVVLRLDHSKITGIDEHDLRKYDGKKEKEWGNYGCGGKDDAGREDGKLDKIARLTPIKDVTSVQHVDEAEVAIRRLAPISIASGVGFGNMKRNADGVVAASGSWQHQMMGGGIRYLKGYMTVGMPHIRTASPRRDFRIFQSWGKSCSGPDPGITHEAISWCSWWAVEKDFQRILNARDSYAFSGVQGFKRRSIKDFTTGVL
jgi:hypothetical protein